MSFARTPKDIPRLFAEAWNDRDAKGLARLFAEDADFVNVVGLWWHNRADIERAHDYGLRTFFKASQLSSLGIDVRQLGKDVVIAHVRWKLTGQTSKAGEALDARTTIMMFVAQRQEAGWIVVAAHNTDVIPGTETNVAKDGRLDAVDYR
jgi:uncharacterized protein (TIGR02246 family)